ncbi:uncharacterized protein [Triticum aestivum]|uniref:uncharacterized protein n=1 Tax=Triticum aestivum TaxID=4565 RepID=UPI001D00265B|nr:uncharacterized protein LOC123042495 [Triticum aestivum]
MATAGSDQRRAATNGGGDAGASNAVATTAVSGSAVAGDDTSRMPIFQTRWSAKRLREIANDIKGKKRDVISKSSFGDLLFISPLVPPPEELLDFIIMNIDPKNRVLKYVKLILSLRIQMQSKSATKLSSLPCVS